MRWLRSSQRRKVRLMSKKSRKKQKRKRATTPDRNGIPAGVPGAPEENSDAGPAADLSRAYLVKQVSGYRATALRQFGEAKRLVKIAGGPAERSGAEATARHAIDQAVRAFWWAEDSDLEERQHELMHKIGRWTRSQFGCQLEFDGTTYFETCPIQMAHRRMGMSAAFIGTRICTICGEDLSECEHVRGRSCWVRGERNSDGRCRVCCAADCEHRPDRLYRTSVGAIITNITEVREVSLVGRPAQPEARLTKISVSTEGLSRALGPEFHLGVRVSCDQCLGECWGFAELGESVDSAPPTRNESGLSAQ